MRKCSNKSKSRNRYDYGGSLSQQLHDLYASSGGNGIANTISTNFNYTQKQGRGIVDSAYNFNPIASNKDELLDLYDTYSGVNKINQLNNKDIISLYGKNILSDVSTGSGIAGGYGVIGGLITGSLGSILQKHNIDKDIDATNAYIDLQNARQHAALSNARDNLLQRERLGFEAGYYRDGGDINYFNNGGTHEQNPYGGIPQGIAPNNAMNVVEEGEVKWESPNGDYIFSNNQKLNKQDVIDNFLPNNLKGKTIAQAAKQVLKESDEREYDYISKNGKDHFLNILRDINESKRPESNNVNSFANGGSPGEDDPYYLWGYWNHSNGTPRQKALIYNKEEIRHSGWTTGENAYKLTQPSNNIKLNINTGHSGIRYTSDPKDYNYRRGEIYNGPWRIGNNSTLQAENPDNLPEEVNTLSAIGNRITKPNTPNTITTPSGEIPRPKASNNTSTASTTPSKVEPDSQAVVSPQKREPLNVLPELSEKNKQVIALAAQREKERVDDALKEDAKKYNTIERSPYQYVPKTKNSTSRDGKFVKGLSKAGDVVSALAPMFAAAFDRPNYNYVNEMRSSFKPVDTPYVSSANYMKYTPIDLDYILNQVNRQSSANARNIMNLSGGNRATAMAGLLGNDFNTYTAQGNAMLQTDLQNMQNYQNVQKHNTGINEFDINSYNTNARFNAEELARARQTAAIMGQQEYDAWKDREYANLSQGLTNLQNLKKEGWTDKQIQMLVDSGAIAWDPRTGQYVIKDMRV